MTLTRAEKLEKIALLKKLRAEAEEKRKRIKQLEAEEKKYRDKIQLYERANKLMFFGHEGRGWIGSLGQWGPNKLQKKLFEAFKDRNKKIFVYGGANRIGKTTSGVILVITCLLGHYPWEDPKVVGHWLWEMRGWEPPIRIRIVGQDWEKHIKTVVIPALKELWPRSMPVEIKKNNVGVESNWCFTRNGSTIEIMSNNQESELFEGWKGHFVYYDEPSKRDIRVACVRGLVDYIGLEFFGMTLLKEAWVDQDVINATNEDGSIDTSVFSLVGDIMDNVGFGITEEGIRQFEKALTPEEKQARLRGIPSYKAELLLPIDKNIHVIPRFEIPTNYLIDVSIDIGIARPHDIAYLATAPNGFKYLCFEETVIGDGDKIADTIFKKQERYHLRLNEIICDPLAKSDRNNEYSTWEKIVRALHGRGYRLKPASKNKDEGVIAIRNHLETIHGIPALYFFSDCSKTIKQCCAIIRDDHGKISKKDDDMFENLYRLMLLDTMYTDYEEEEEPTSRDTRSRNLKTGY